MTLWIGAFVWLTLFQVCASQNVSDVCVNNTCSSSTSKCRPDKRGGYFCLCNRGFKGSNCDEDLDECSRGDPCRHRGNCVNTPGSYKCACLSGWTGNHCLHNTTDPSECIYGWLGDECGIDLNECTDSNAVVSCINNSTCKNTPGSYICDCLPGYQGYTCGDDVNECLTFPCENSGKCINALGSFSCDCVAPWTGYRCEVQSVIKKEGDSTNISVILGPSLGSLFLIGGVVGGVFLAKHIRKKRLIGDAEETCTTVIEVDQEATTTTNGHVTGDQTKPEAPDGDGKELKQTEANGDVEQVSESDPENVKKVVMKTRFSLKKIFNK